MVHGVSEGKGHHARYSRGEARRVMWTKYQIVELAKESLPIDLFWWIEAVPSPIPEQTTCSKGGELEMQAQKCN